MQIWSFSYIFGGALYSLEIEAETQAEAEGRIAVIGAAVCDGAIRPDIWPSDGVIAPRAVVCQV